MSLALCKNAQGTALCHDADASEWEPSSFTSRRQGHQCVRSPDAATTAVRRLTRTSRRSQFLSSRDRGETRHFWARRPPPRAPQRIQQTRRAGHRDEAGDRTRNMGQDSQSVIQQVSCSAIRKGGWRNSGRAQAAAITSRWIEDPPARVRAGTGRRRCGDPVESKRDTAVWHREAIASGPRPTPRASSPRWESSVGVFGVVVLATYASLPFVDGPPLFPSAQSLDAFSDGRRSGRNDPPGYCTTFPDGADQPVEGERRSQCVHECGVSDGADGVDAVLPALPRSASPPVGCDQPALSRELLLLRALWPRVEKAQMSHPAGIPGWASTCW